MEEEELLLKKLLNVFIYIQHRFQTYKQSGTI